jgi:two-component system, OmpR family, sensor histidine kinase CreC
MYLGIRLIFAGVAILGVAWFFVLNAFVNEIKPIAREVMEELMVDSAHYLAELATDDLVAGTIATGRFASATRGYRARQVDADIWGMGKDTLDFEVIVTDARGMVQFDSLGRVVGQDFSAWRDIRRTLDGEYGARATRLSVAADASSIYHVAAPIRRDGVLIGVLSVSKDTETVTPFMQRSEARMLRSGVALLACTVLIGALITLWTVYEVRRLAHYADDAEAGRRVPVPQVRGELGKLARSIALMRERLEGQHYVERYVTALTHELKSPIAAIRASGELLRDDIPAVDRERFAQHVVQQSERLQRSVERLLELTRIEQTQVLGERQMSSLSALIDEVIDALKPLADAAAVRVEKQVEGALDFSAALDRDLMRMALTNVIENAIAFSLPGQTVTVSLRGDTQTLHGAEISVTDQGPGVDADMLRRVGEKFVSTPRPSGAPKSSGLGLAITTQVVALHGGTFTLVNTAPGTRATLSLKTHDAPSASV